MTETQMVLQIPLRLAPVVIFAFFYALGGRGWTPWRRFVGSSVFMACIVVYFLAVAVLQFGVKVE